jgi:DGQHR domain-containing protein
MATRQVNDAAGATKPRETTRAWAKGTQIVNFVVPNRVAFATVTPETMKHILFVSTVDVADPDSEAPRKHGYQRAPMESRFPGIARYFRENEHMYLITPIIVSVRLTEDEDIEEFTRLFNEGDFAEIHHRWHKAVVSIVDGQHRFRGLVKAHDEDPEFNPIVPVMLYFDLDYLTEAALFDTINTTQRKLPRALIELTKGDITEKGVQSHAQRVREIAFAIARDKDSVWFGGINMTGARDPERRITYEGLRRSTANMFPAELVSRLAARGETPEEWAKAFWRSASEGCDAAWKERPVAVRNEQTGEVEERPVEYRLKDLVGVASLARLAKDIITSAIEHANARDWMVNEVSKLSEVDWEKREDNPWMRSQAGFAGQKELYTMLHDLVYLGRRPGEEA